MSLFLTPPILPEFDTLKPIEDQWKSLSKTLNGFFKDVALRANATFVKDGSEPMKVTGTTLPAGTVYFEGMTRSDTINAYFSDGGWRSWDTARPSYRLLQDMQNDRFRIDRAAATTGSLTWATLKEFNAASAAYAGAYISAGYTPAAGWQVLRCDTEYYDPQSAFTAASYRYDPPLAGYYHVHADCEVNDTNGMLRVMRGASVWSRGPLGLIVGAYAYPVVDCDIYIATPATDFITVQLYTLAGAAVSGGANSFGNFFVHPI